VWFTVAVDKVSEFVSSNLTSAPYCWHKADFNGLNERLINFDWNQMMMDNFDADTLWASFNQVLQSAVNDFVPIRNISSRKQVTARYPAQIRAALTRKRCLWKLRKHNPNDVTISNKYRSQLAECQKLICEYEIKREETVIQANNIGKFYSFVNGKMTCHSDIGALKTSDGSIVLSDNAKGELLNEYFVSTGILDNGVLPPAKPLVADDTFLESVNCGKDKICKEIKWMKANGSAGPDGYPPILLKKFASSLVTPLLLLYSSFMSVGQVPNEWKRAIVIPVHKGELASDPGNYRPVSLTSVFCKLMERLINRQVLDYLHHKLLNDQQHGFLARRSTVTY